MTPGLIERLEAAGEGSRELDREIASECGWTNLDVPTFWVKSVCDAAGFPPGTAQATPLPHYTTSLDAALALAERVGWRLYKLDASIISRSSVMLQSVDDRPRVDPDSGATLMGKDFAVGSSKTPALALCIAILKARATQEQK